MAAYLKAGDTCDFGGGFYFTLLLGAEGSGFRADHRAGPQDGWLVGEAILEDGTLKGTLAFYPYPRDSTPGFDVQGQPKPSESVSATISGRQPWLPRRVFP